MIKISQGFGILASTCQMVGNLCFDHYLFLRHLPLPKLLAPLLFFLCGIFWALEALFEDLPEGETSRWNHVHSCFLKAWQGQSSSMVWTAAAGILAIASIALSFLTGPLSWTVMGLSLFCALCWYQGSSFEDTTKCHVSQIAALTEFASLIFFSLSLILVPYVPVGISAMIGVCGVFCRYISAGLWMISYGLEEPKPVTEPLVLKKEEPVIDQKSARLNFVYRPKVGRDLGLDFVMDFDKSNPQLTNQPGV